MAQIAPFRGILYNPDKISDLSKVATPPYDVISQEEQCYFYDCHPHNIIRLILGKQNQDDSCDQNCHTRAAECFSQWISEEILIQDKAPAFYLTSIEFPIENRKIKRLGLIALIRLEPFEKGIVLPHEKTFSKVKSERLELMKVCHTNFSPIFSLYPDSDRILDSLKNKAADKTPDTEFTDYKGHHHQLWRITDPAVHAEVSDAMKEKRIFIADGHHRYETALNYRDWIAARTPGFSPDHPANYVMMYLSSMEDPGVIILPAHRMLKGLQESVISAFIEKSGNYFDVVRIPFGNNGHGRIKFISALKSYASKNAVGVSIKGCRELYLLTLKADVMEKLFGNELSQSLRNLDVTVLTRLILMEILGFDQARLDNEKLISYSSIAEEALDIVAAGKCDMTFILNPTRIEQVKEIAEQGLIMPRKSTYFYPKVITGQVINILK